MIESSVLYWLAGCALLLAWLCFRPALRFARKHNIVDHPNKRKLQDAPVPIFGSVVVAMGMFLPLLYVILRYNAYPFAYQLAVMTLLLVVGILDDIYDISPWSRLLIEIVLVIFYIGGTHSIIDNLYGLFGIQELLPVYIGLPLSVVAGVGIINALNLIDGVDGYSSGYGIAANLLFTIVFCTMGDYVSAVVSVIAAAALIPFFIHNVYGNSSKMFIGDGGSLLIGMVMVCDVFALLTRKDTGAELSEHGVGVVALALAVLCIPVFDTLRVMTARMVSGRSPLSPDKTHLHHRFINLGFSHLGTSLCIIATNLLIVGIWFLIYMLDGNEDLQFWMVVISGLIATCGFYYGSLWCEKKQNSFYQLLCRLGKWTHFERRGLWQSIQHLLDHGL